MGRFAFPQSYSPDSSTLGLDPLSYRLLEAFYDNGSAMIDHLRKIGVMEFEQHTLGEGGPLSPDYAEHLPENKIRAGRALAPMDTQGRSMASHGSRGSRLIDALETWLTARRAVILTERRVTRLVMHGDRCSGVEARNGEKTELIRARKGVIFASGGFAHNTDLLQLHHTIVYGSCAVPQATGDFVAIASAVGAQFGTMRSAWRTQVALEEALDNRVMGRAVYLVPGDSMMLVNKYGRRAVNEKRNYNDRTRVHYTYDPTNEDYPNQLLFMVFDARARDLYAGSYPIPRMDETGRLIAGATLAELSANIATRLRSLQNWTGGVALAPDFQTTLRQAMTRFNEFARSGRDLDFDRGLHEYDRAWNGYFSVIHEDPKRSSERSPNPTMHPIADQGPYYAIILAPGVLDTSGGPLIDERARVLGADGRPIPGLYGAGNCVASPSREAYFGGGGTIGLAMTFGYIAAMNASGRNGLHE